MHLQEISQSGSVDSGDEDFAENWFISVFVFRDFSVPQSPLVLIYIPIIIIAKSTFGEFDFNQRSIDSVEFVKDLVIVLSSTDTSSVCPHRSEDEESLIDYFLILFFLFRAIDADYIFVLLD